VLRGRSLCSILKILNFCRLQINFRTSPFYLSFLFCITSKLRCCLLKNFIIYIIAVTLVFLLFYYLKRNIFLLYFLYIWRPLSPKCDFVVLIHLVFIKVKNFPRFFIWEFEMARAFRAFKTIVEELNLFVR